jgi:hypothetical protein
MTTKYFMTWRSYPVATTSNAIPVNGNMKSQTFTGYLKEIGKKAGTLAGSGEHKKAGECRWKGSLEKSQKTYEGR